MERECSSLAVAQSNIDCETPYAIDFFVQPLTAVFARDAAASSAQMAQSANRGNFQNLLIGGAAYT